MRALNVLFAFWCLLLFALVVSSMFDGIEYFGRHFGKALIPMAIALVSLLALNYILFGSIRPWHGRSDYD